MLVKFIDYKGRVVFINPEHVTSLQTDSDGVSVYDVSGLVSAILSDPIEAVAAKLNSRAETDRSSLSAESLIQRAIETLKTASRYTVAPVSRQELNWDKNPDGPVTDSKAVDEAISILEGE